MRISIVTAILTSAGILTVNSAADASESEAVSCSSLASLSVDHTAIEKAEIVGAGEFVEPPATFSPFVPDYSGLPAFCRVTGSIQPTPESDIRFELWLPENNWNGRFLQTGNGGAAGSILYFSMIEPLARGYAVANRDTGHRGAIGEFNWIPQQAEKLRDYEYRAVQELTTAGKAITTARYGRTPEKSYFEGCSTGGRQGLTIAQRYPGDYDAIIAGAPANNWSAAIANSIVTQRNLGEGGIAVEKLHLLKEAALATCDGSDGVEDRVITDPDQCDFDPAILLCEGEVKDRCLNPEEVEAARRIHAGVIKRDGELLIAGTGPASEPDWAGFATSDFQIGTSYFRYAVIGDPDWNPASFEPDRDWELIERAHGGQLSAMDPDLSDFIAGGGKLLIYHGTTDGMLPYKNSVNYYESAVKALGAEAIDDNVKFYLVPGMDHCSGGEGAFLVDWLSALELWEEEGLTPAALQGVHPAAGSGQSVGSPGKVFTRPICPYPQIAQYNGGGDPDDAASFRCADPQIQP